MDIFAVANRPFIARRNYYVEMQHMLLWGLVVSLVEGNFAAVIAAQTFSGSEILVNIASTTPVAAHMASLLWGMLSVGRPKLRVFSTCLGGVVLFLASVALTPETKWGGWLFITQMAAAQFFMSGVLTLRSALWKSNYPQASRGATVANLQIVRSVMRLLAVSVAARLFDHDPSTYRYVYPTVAFVGAIAWLIAQRLRVRGERRELGALAAADRSGGNGGALVQRASLPELLARGQLFSNAIRVLRADVFFRRYMEAQMLAGFANLAVRSVVVVIITRELLAAMPAAAYWISAALLELLPILVSLIAMKPLARLFDRVGVLRFRLFHGIFWVLNSLFGMLGTAALAYSEQIGPNYVVFATASFAAFGLSRGLAYGGGRIAWSLGHLHFAHPQDAEVYMGIHVTLTGLRGLLLPSLGMLIWTLVGWPVWIVSGIAAVGALAAFHAIHRQEQKGGLTRRADQPYNRDDDQATGV